MQNTKSTREYAAEAIAQQGSQIREVRNMAAVKIGITAVSSGTIKVYGSDDYANVGATDARWIPLPTIDTLGVRVAADTAITPLTTKDIYADVSGYTHFKITEQNAGTLTAQVHAFADVPPEMANLLGATTTTDIAVTDDAAFTPGTGKGVAMFGMADETAPDSVNEGDAGALRMTLDRKLIGASDRVDDAAFTPGTHYVSVIGAQADETAPDSVDEGDAGALRMTLDRKLITATDLVDDAAFTPGTSYVSAIGAMADETSPDSVNEGDIGILRMTLDRQLRVMHPEIQCYSFIPDGTDELLIDATARKIWGVDVFTIDATPVYVKLYDKATAASEADTPVHRTGVPANATAALGAGNNKGIWPGYIPVTNGLSVRAVTGIADNSDAALTTAENLINVYWSI